MQTKWDYTNASKTYNKRPQYSQETINEIFNVAQLKKGDTVCDIGAGTGYLSIKLSAKQLNITAIEPNHAMRTIGKNNTKKTSSIQWFDATAESSQQLDNSFDLISFGSSFNVVDREKALKEASRIVRSKGYFCAIWNHRNLNNSLQKEIENCINNHIPNYNYGIRREDQGVFLRDSKLFSTVLEITHSFRVLQKTDDIINAWKSHQTLIKQAGNRFADIISDIKDIIYSHPSDTIVTPYSSRCWLAQFKK